LHYHTYDLLKQKYKKFFGEQLDKNNILINKSINKYFELKNNNHLCISFRRSLSLRLYEFNNKSLNSMSLNFPQDPSVVCWCEKNICEKYFPPKPFWMNL
jgi:hypothetical protein